MLRDLRILVILFFFLLNTPKLFPTTAEPDYRECIELMVDVYPSEMSCSAMLIFSFHDLSCPLDFEYLRSEPSFLGLSIAAHYSSGGGYARVSIILNDSKDVGNQGRFIADMLAYRLEKAFGIPTLYYTEFNGTFFSPGMLEFSYFTESPAIESRRVFLGSVPPQGCRQVLTSSLLDSHDHSVYLMMSGEGRSDIEVWLHRVTREMIPGQEQTISLKEITGYLGSIDLSSIAFPSILRIHVTFNIFGDCKLTINKVLPANMPVLVNQETHGTITEYSFSYDVTGSSFEDLSISLTIVSSNLISVAIILGQITVVLCSIIIAARHKK